LDNPKKDNLKKIVKVEYQVRPEFIETNKENEAFCFGSSLDVADFLKLYNRQLLVAAHR
jgi:hypothetical protein